MISDSYKTFRVSVRPPRIACFLNLHDPNWRVSALNIIKAFSRTWGGGYFIIIPTDGRTISRVFWRLLLSYDPDYLWLYDGREGASFEPGFELNRHLQDSLKLWLAPFHIAEFVTQDWAYPNFVPSHPYTDVIDILPNCDAPRTVTEISGLRGNLELYIAAVTGSASPEFREALGLIGIQTQLREVTDESHEFFETVIAGIQRRGGDSQTAFPFEISLTQLGFYQSLKFHNWLETTLVVLGDSLEDFCLYYALSRMRRKVAWLLPSWLAAGGSSSTDTSSRETPLASFSRGVSELARAQGGRSQIFLLSISNNAEDIAAIRTTLTRSWPRLPVEEGLPREQGQEPSDRLDSSLEWLLRFPSRVYEKGNVDKIISRHFFGEDMAGFLETPKPRNFLPVPPTGHYWITELSTINHQLPRHPSLGNDVVLSGTITSLQSRSGREAVAFFCPNSAFFGGDLDETLVKPSIHLPNAISVFQRLLNSVNLECQVSDKGRFSLDTLSKFGSVSSLCQVLLTDSKKAVFDKYRDSKPQPDIRDEGIFLQSDRRRYLDFRAILKILGDERTAASFLDDLIGKSVLHRGLILKCEFCRSTDWFSIAELSHEFRCKRCGRTQIYRQSHALFGSEPTWYYKLDEIVFKALVNDFDVPMIALDRLRRDTDSFLFSPEIEIRNRWGGDLVFELDICCIPNGQVTIGEAKKNSRLANTARKENEIIEKYFDLSAKLGAAQVVFATSSEQWRVETIRLIRQRFANCLTKVVIWSRGDLQPPP